LKERKKKDLFANVGDLKTMSKKEYREFRGQKFYTMPRISPTLTSTAPSMRGSMSRFMLP
jgi:hypothetical protein